MPKITKVTRLSEYMEVICNRPYPRNEHYTRHQNEIYTIYNEFKEILSSAKIDVKDKSNQQRENDERIAEFIRKHAVDLYDYIYRIKRIRENTKQDKVDQVYFYRGVNSANYLIAPGIYRENEKHDENYYFNEITEPLSRQVTVLFQASNLSSSEVSRLDFVLSESGRLFHASQFHRHDPCGIFL